MRKFKFSRQLLIAAFALPLLATAQTNINITVNGLEASEVLLGYYLAEQKYVEDTLTVGPGGEVVLNYEESLRPGLYFLFADPFYQEFVINEPSFSLTMGREGFKTFDPVGSPENELFKRFQLEGAEIQIKRNELMQQLQGLSGEDSLQLVTQIQDLREQGVASRSALVTENPDLLISKMLTLMQPIEFKEFPEIADERERKIASYLDYREQFKQRLDFTETGLLRTPVFKTNVIKYFRDVVRPQVPDTLNAEIDEVLATVKDDQVSFRYWLVTLLDFYQASKTMGHDAVLVHILEKYYLSGAADWMEEEGLNKMREEVAFLKPNLIGQPAPALNLLDTLMSPVNVLNLPDDFLVLFFYDPDCGVCKKKTPLLLDAYYDLKDLGAEVVAVCVPTDIERWKEYINEGQLDWINLADPFRRSNFRAEYDVRSFPRVFVLDKNRKIIAKRLAVEQLVGFITDYKRQAMP
ncbi:MAG: thioredoxin family protein [Cytophagales bacterium]|nr:thioredoxin family protein [Cytophagales bacterium]